MMGSVNFRLKEVMGFFESLGHGMRGWMDGRTNGGIGCVFGGWMLSSVLYPGVWGHEF